MVSVHQEYTHCKLSIVDGVLYSTYFPNLTMNLEVAKQCVADRISFTEGRTYPHFMDTRRIKYVDIDAREYLSKEGVENVSAIAFFVETQVEKLIWSIFQKYDLSIPTTLFTDKAEAFEWLKNYKTGN